MYKKAYTGNKLKHLGPNWVEIHLWEEDKGHQIVPYNNIAYQECTEEEQTHTGLNGEPLKPISKWFFSKNPDYSSKNTPNLHFHDMKPHQKFLVERYGVNDVPSKGHREVFFDIECEIGGALTEEYIEDAPMPITSIAWWDKQTDEWAIVILDKTGQLKHTKTGENKNKEIIPCATENELLAKFVEAIREMDPDILVGYNSDYFDIPYLYYRICKVLGPDWGNELSPIGQVQSKATSDVWYYRDCYVRIAGIQSLDYIRLHKKYSWADEPSWKLDRYGE